MNSIFCCQTNPPGPASFRRRPVDWSREGNKEEGAGGGAGVPNAQAPRQKGGQAQGPVVECVSLFDRGVSFRRRVSIKIDTREMAGACGRGPVKLVPLFERYIKSILTEIFFQIDSGPSASSAMLPPPPPALKLKAKGPSTMPPPPAPRSKAQGPAPPPPAKSKRKSKEMEMEMPPPRPPNSSSSSGSGSRRRDTSMRPPSSSSSSRVAQR